MLQGHCERGKDASPYLKSRFTDDFRLDPSLSGLTLTRVHVGEETRPITDFVPFFPSVDVNRNQSKKLRNGNIRRATIPTIFPDLDPILSQILDLLSTI